jgi:hypothetical protein
MKWGPQKIILSLKDMNTRVSCILGALVNTCEYTNTSSDPKKVPIHRLCGQRVEQ